MKDTPTLCKHLWKKDIVEGKDRSRRACENWGGSTREVSGNGEDEIQRSEGFVDPGGNRTCISGEYHGKRRCLALQRSPKAVWGGRASGSVCRNEEINGTLKVCERAPYAKG